MSRRPSWLLRTAAAATFAVVAASSAHAAEPTASTQPSPIDEQRQRRSELETEIRSMAEIPDKKLADVLVLEMDGPALVARSHLAPARFPRSFHVEGMPGLFGVTLRTNRRGVPMRLDLRRLDSSDPRFTFVHTQLGANEGHLTIDCETEGPRFVSMVQFIDDRQFVDPLGPHPEGQCTLYMQVSDVADEQPILNTHYAESDLPTLTRRHRAAVDAYLRPALRELGYERLLLPDQAEARQVVTGGATADDETKRKVVRLVTALDAEDYAARRRASDDLKQLGPAATDALVAIRRGKLSPEQRNRVDEIIRRDRPLEDEEAERLRHDLAFLIDCLDLDDASLRVAAKGQLEQETGKPVAFDPKADLLQRQKAIDALREEWLAPPEMRPPATQPTAPQEGESRDRG